MRSILIAIRTAVVFLLICGLLYPFLITGIAQLLFPKQAAGSLISNNGKVIGSELIAQEFSGPEWFHPRALAANESTTANAPVASKEYLKKIEAHINQLKKENGEMGKTIPADLLTSSGSGFDPDLSPEAAKVQVPRIAKAKGISQAQLNSLINKQIKGRSLGIFGEPRVNVLDLNLALQHLSENR